MVAAYFDLDVDVEIEVGNYEQTTMLKLGKNL